jgi:hypothetical protein
VPRRRRRRHRRVYVITDAIPTTIIILVDGSMTETRASLMVFRKNVTGIASDITINVIIIRN